MEVVVATAWEGALGVSGVGPYDTFWELGGTSLSAVKMLRMLQEALQDTEAFFNHSKVSPAVDCRQ
jgi:hypothetical protein